MVFNSNIFDSASASSQAIFNGGKAQNVEAPVYTQAFEAGNKKANLYLTVTSDKLLLTMITEKPQLRDSNPETPRAASLHDWLPADFWAQARADLDFGNSLRAG
ncbi:hypothetical protein DSO57_1008641 [Entomophthora muscae]|uniref:Uncharacterized protein n=1 Tax=Entomophthora muscae TaxID=34485 RepID=A0ACC2TUV0_9FUNG|nr:hypothetical protein DSO57_1008641 [Entomophthora muscae]